MSIAFDDGAGAPFDRWLLLKSLPAPLPQRPGAARAARPQPPAPRQPVTRRQPDILHHGDHVQFQHGSVIGEGKLVASSMAAVIVKTADDVEHRIRHQDLVQPDAAAER